MTKNALLVTFLAMSFTSFNAANAQQSGKIDLKQAIQLALDSNLLVRSSAYSVDVQKALKGAAWDIPKMSIDGQYGQFNSYAKDNSFTVSQSFAFPSVYINQHQLARANVESSEWQLRASQLEIATQVKQIYWQLAYLLSKRRLLGYEDSLYSGFQRAAELKARAGETNRLEMITARSQSMEVKNRLQQVNADLSIYHRKLQILLNSAIIIHIADTLLQRIAFSPPGDSAVLVSNPSAVFMQQQVEISRLEKKVESGRMLPDFNISYFSQTLQGIQEVNGTPRMFGSNNRFTGIQAGISIPLWFVPYAAKIKVSGLKQRVAQTNARYYAKSLSGNYETLLDEYTKYNNSLEYYEKHAVPEANLIIEQATRSYKAGVLDYTEYIVNLGRALSIRHSHLDALHNYNQTVISIESIANKLF